MKSIRNRFSPADRIAKYLLGSALVLVFAFATITAQAQFEYGNSISRKPEPSIRLADNERSQGDLRSRSDVVKEVKRRYDARVLKITLNESRGIYQVRILDSDGKVRNVTVSAYR